jgi:hypothetical protein
MLGQFTKEVRELAVNNGVLTRNTFGLANECAV